MEIRVLQYFLAVAREQSISAAAEALHLSQPTLSRQLKDLEDELGKPLMIRGNRRITLTEEGMLLRKRAQEIVDLVLKTENELTVPEEIISGDIYIGAGETDSMRLLVQAAKNLQQDFPQIHYHLSSGVDLSKYNTLPLPMRDTWGILMRCDSPLAEKKTLTVEDLMGLPLIVSRQLSCSGELIKLLGDQAEHLNIFATYNLIYNGSLMVDEGLGYALTLDKLISMTGNSSLCFRPLMPKKEIGMRLVWKRYQVFSKAAEQFLKAITQQLETSE